jgi:hypothetical protein
VAERLRGVDPDRLTPLDALKLLHELREALAGEAGPPSGAGSAQADAAPEADA